VSLPLTETLSLVSLNQLSCSTQLKTTKENFEKDMEHLGRVLDDLDELGEIISEMLQTQETIQVRVIF
jgi:autophagy-related protein 17